MLEPWAEAVMVFVALVMAGGAGYWLRGFVDEWRLRGVLRRVHEAVADVHPDWTHRHPDGLAWIYDGEAGKCVRMVPIDRREGRTL